MIWAARHRQVHLVAPTEHDHGAHEQRLRRQWHIRNGQVHHAVQFDVDLLLFDRVQPVELVALVNVNVEIEAGLRRLQIRERVPVLRV